jgi:hypothetical protein
MTHPVWNEIETTLRQIHGLKHNLLDPRRKGVSTDDVVVRKLAEIKSGLVGDPKREEFTGPRLFLRVAGPKNAAYGGEWWFNADVLDRLDRAYSRIYFERREKDEAIRNMLREGLAISHDFRNAISEVWALELPAGSRIVGYTAKGEPQKLFGNLPISAHGNRRLVGGVEQIYFPVKDPFWVKQYRNLV